MDALREGIGLQGYGQKDPKKEYKKAGFTLFTEMMDRIQENVVTKMFRVQIQREEEAIPALAGEAAPDGRARRRRQERGRAPTRATQQAPRSSVAAASRAHRRAMARSTAAGASASGPKVGRNDPCPCGSGKKYKKCHGKDEEAPRPSTG